MSTVTTNLGLFKYNTTTDANVAFNINTALNNNWDIIDSAMAGGGLPDQTGKSGYLLTTNGSTASWGETGEIYPVIETYIEGTSWYRVYSDDWCEQGGISPSAGDTSSNTITLLRSYKDTNYSIFFAQNAGIEGSYTNGCTAKNKTTSSFVLVYRTGGTASFYWHACGYIEV